MATMELGKLRSLASCADSDGFFTVLALDALEMGSSTRRRAGADLRDQQRTTDTTRLAA